MTTSLEQVGGMPGGAIIRDFLSLAFDDSGVAVGSVNPLARAFGYLNWNFDPGQVSAGSGPTAGDINATPIWLPRGLVVSNVVLNLVTAAAGAVPTSFVVGITDGVTMLAQSGELKSNAALIGTTGDIALPLSAPWAVPTTGLYYIVFLQVGAFGTTQPTFGRGPTTSTPGPRRLAGARQWGTFATGQTALPANGVSPGTLASVSGNAYYFAGVS